ncbi:MAG: site-specific integrase [Lachnospiraceae bacterium]|nr:site-specific integrase [Lachnospiraceae bacterium]
MTSRKDPKGRLLRQGEIYHTAKQTYMYSYTDIFGKRRYIYAKDLVTLRKKEDNLKRDQMDGIDAYLAGTADLNYIFDRYLSARSDLRETTKANYEATYDRYVRETIGKRKLSDLKYSQILLFYTGLITEKNLHIGTIQYIQRLIRPALQMAVRDDIIRTNPADGAIHIVKQKTQCGEGQTRHALTLEQQRAFINYIKDNPHYERWYPLFVVLVGTGVRVGELVGLRWKDVDFDKREIHINHSLTYFAGKKNKSPCKWVISEPKTESGYRTIPMINPVYEALIDEKNKQKTKGLRCHTEIDGMTGFIFYNRFFEVYVPESINREITRIIENYNNKEEVAALRQKRKVVLLPPISCHHLRHTFCARLCEADIHIKVIQSIMGHKDIHTTLDIYSEVTDWKKQTSINEAFENMKLF